MMSMRRDSQPIDPDPPSFQEIRQKSTFVRRVRLVMVPVVMLGAILAVGFRAIGTVRADVHQIEILAVSHPVLHDISFSAGALLTLEYLWVIALALFLSMIVFLLQLLAEYGLSVSEWSYYRLQASHAPFLAELEFRRFRANSSATSLRFAIGGIVFFSIAFIIVVFAPHLIGGAPLASLVLSIGLLLMVLLPGFFYKALSEQTISTRLMYLRTRWMGYLFVGFAAFLISFVLGVTIVLNFLVAPMISVGNGVLNDLVESLIIFTEKTLNTDLSLEIIPLLISLYPITIDFPRLGDPFVIVAITLTLILATFGLLVPRLFELLSLPRRLAFARVVMVLILVGLSLVGSVLLPGIAELLGPAGQPLIILLVASLSLSLGPWLSFFVRTHYWTCTQAICRYEGNDLTHRYCGACGKERVEVST